MSEQVTVTPMKGDVNRGIDFNLKKEDLMLLILEGRKEIMEEKIAELQKKQASLLDDQGNAQKKFDEKLKHLALASINVEARKMVPVTQEMPFEKFARVELSTYAFEIPYILFSSGPIGDGRGGAYIKHQRNSNVTVWLAQRVIVKVELQDDKAVYARKTALYKNTISPAGSYKTTVQIVDEYLDLEYQKTLPEYKKLVEIATEYSQVSSLLSDVISEYDLFNRNQPRAKAKMIKEVLSRDAQGKEMLDNIFQAAKGVKLLG